MTDFARENEGWKRGSEGTPIVVVADEANSGRTEGIF